MNAERRYGSPSISVLALAKKGSNLPPKRVNFPGSEGGKYTHITPRDNADFGSSVCGVTGVCMMHIMQVVSTTQNCFDYLTDSEWKRNELTIISGF